MPRGIRGRCRVERPPDSCENGEAVGLVERDAEIMASRILVSNFFAIISAALPLGARMKGT